MFKIPLQDLNFYNKIEKEIQHNPDIINSIDKEWNNYTYIELASLSGLIDKVAYLLDKGINIYLVDSRKDNPLHKAVAYAFNAKSDKNKDINNAYQIFRLLLNYEAEQRVHYPNKYINQILLKDQTNNINVTPLRKTQIDQNIKDIEKELLKAIEEAHQHYLKCKKAIENGESFTPYHKQFLPQELLESRSLDSPQLSPNIIRMGRDIDSGKWVEKINQEQFPLLGEQQHSTSPSKIFGYVTSLFSGHDNKSNGKVKTQ